MRRALVSLIFSMSLPPVAHAEIQPASDGMFLCRSPVVAHDFYNDLLTATQTGVLINRTIAAQIAKNNQCEFVASSQLKAVDFVAGQMAISDGRVTAWAAPQLYISYLNSAPLGGANIRHHAFVQNAPDVLSDDPCDTGDCDKCGRVTQACRPHLPN